MRCLYPIKASRCPKSGTVALWPKGREAENEALRIPCGSCINCRMQDRLGWALRCTLEAAEWRSTTFATLTYNENNCPPGLELRDLQLFLKRLRRLLGAKKRGKRKISHFSCGEYGERTRRPHYHALLFGLHHETDRALIEEAWSVPGSEGADGRPEPIGHVRLGPADVGAIHYVVGYQNKKLGDFEHSPMEHVDEETGEIITLRNPFRIMSKRPAIGANARKWRNAWRTHAVLDGKTIAVPRFLHRAWKDNATPEEVEQRTHDLLQRQLQQPLPEQRLLTEEERKEARTHGQLARAIAIKERQEKDALEYLEKERQKRAAERRTFN